mmetsp:Transcript_40601/g.65866  ORF Transcript_40601/g.65866 Transcript_40601/m.65866 type:complete len:484 (+) Transcript_40601:275-1726(+)|eukprot:CAMPEP_0184654404 /NCGR_PEP_ID=MMETSP0308-20130426/12089_1 /TAXON_ID=38269 /ORGANISM="Gloeochaete witrockiana, Strain SAG 46.84" /LENGTH=483 /DNA_ID=CAMNT_0027090375 /DNA_START=256 /DNA_END=1707 /DNA_ORIENTATION=+
MKVIVFGASTRLGYSIVTECLIAQHQVTAYVQNSKEKSLFSDRVKVCVGDILSREQVESAVRKQDIILVALGHGHGLKWMFWESWQNPAKARVLYDGVKNIVRGMERQRVVRILCVACAGVLAPDNSDGFLGDARGFRMRWYQRPEYEEHKKIYGLLIQSSLEWTMICPFDMHTGTKKGRFLVGVEKHPEEASPRISIGDVAHFMVRFCDAPQYICRRVGVGYAPPDMWKQNGQRDSEQGAEEDEPVMPYSNGPPNQDNNYDAQPEAQVEMEQEPQKGHGRHRHRQKQEQGQWPEQAYAEQEYQQPAMEEQYLQAAEAEANGYRYAAPEERRHRKPPQAVVLEEVAHDVQARRHRPREQPLAPAQREQEAEDVESSPVQADHRRRERRREKAADIEAAPVVERGGGGGGREAAERRHRRPPQEEPPVQKVAVERGGGRDTERARRRKAPAPEPEEPPEQVLPVERNRSRAPAKQGKQHAKSAW